MGKTNYMSIKYSYLLVLLPIFLWGQQYDDVKITNLIDDYRNLDRGPYKEINWFCEDGTVRDAKDPCPDAIGGGIQHASYKTEVVNLSKNRHIFLGEILASNDVWDFWDAPFDHSRVKQYQLQRYLESVDNGWIQEKSKFYRGAKQIEDEEEWGRKFYYTILSSNQILNQDFFLIRESLRDIPHDGDTNLAQEIRSVSKIIADKYPKFMDIRIKIHGNPESRDIQQVQEWYDANKPDLNQQTQADFDKLITDMKEFFEPVSISELAQMVSDWNKDSYIRTQTDWFSQTYAQETDPSIIIPAASGLMCDIRYNIQEDRRGTRRTSALELSLRLEELIFQKSAEWVPATVREHMDKVHALSEALASSGYVEKWEWDAVENQLLLTTDATMSADKLMDFINIARNQVAWGTGMVNSIYGDVVEEYTGFEPLSYGFYDDRIRSSLLLPLGSSIGEFSGLISRQLGSSTYIPVLSNASSVRGLNPGYTRGELVVVTGNAEGMTVDPKKIYVFDHPPSDLKPVAGIATVSEGNLVSHVQLLARNLGIPNTAISADNLSDLKNYDGKEVFYAVSDRGAVVIKPSSEMDDEERELFNKNEEKEKKTVRISEDKLKLDVVNPIDMASVNSKDSGILCGPKAANLGQLKQLFPDHVVNGIIIPFGVFRNHMSQKMPDTDGSYWDFLESAFAKARQLKDSGSSIVEVEKYQLEQLSILREAIANMPIKSEFIKELRKDFKGILGNDMGKEPVFLRSDTNMEDLEEFTGAGLNLTVFNVVSEEKIMKGIRDVWASPYTDRSFKWRQAYLENPENVYPSILIIPTVDVDYSGVLITKDFVHQDNKGITIAMSRGAGGAVDGQSAETFIVDKDGNNKLVAPARERLQRKLPSEGGSRMEYVNFNNPIISKDNLKEIQQFAKSAHQTMPSSKDGSYQGAWDIELGFKDNKLFLFQIRPFVENSNAITNSYLLKMDQNTDYSTELLINKQIAL
ncbi:phosphoenolpyruvate synthase [Nonlabens mediterrranea]|uniref:Phosphoenolpyruvate synthase n=1 Tax=Nonlabens mediterrranea TaxID=1419947 RepID=A0ABS0A836_9FLAO|nr:phosphoenolpyruvate synthase [Nonlabens mediterrranea]